MSSVPVRKHQVRDTALVEAAACWRPVGFPKVVAGVLTRPIVVVAAAEAGPAKLAAPWSFGFSARLFQDSRCHHHLLPWMMERLTTWKKSAMVVARELLYDAATEVRLVDDEQTQSWRHRGA